MRRRRKNNAVLPSLSIDAGNKKEGRKKNMEKAQIINVETISVSKLSITSRLCGKNKGKAKHKQIKNQNKRKDIC